MNNREKKEAVTGLLMTAFCHYKRIMMAEPGETVLPPTDIEVKHEYMNDPTLNRCVNICLYGVIEIFEGDAAWKQDK
jgi:hypothetical protein